MINNRLPALLGERRMSQKQLSQLTGIREATISNMCNEIHTRYSVEHLDKIFEVLECDINDFFVYTPNKVKTTGENLIVEQHGNNKKL